MSGHGPYWANPAPFYFKVADKQLHSEIGAPNIPPIESVRMMMPEKALWPQALDWGLHDFCLVGAMGGAAFRSIVENSYGGANSAEEWIKLAQYVNYDVYRAMFEAQSKYRMGVLLWMSHSCWPSFVWQTYDYLLRADGGVLRLQEGIGAAAYPVEQPGRVDRGGELQRGEGCRSAGLGGDPEYGWEAR